MADKRIMTPEEKALLQAKHRQEEAEARKRKKGAGPDLHIRAESICEMGICEWSGSIRKVKGNK